MNCPICGSPFEPREGQQEACWAATWCSMGSGLLCLSCHDAAEKLETPLDPRFRGYIGVLPESTRILKLSASRNEPAAKNLVQIWNHEMLKTTGRIDE